MRTWRPSRRSRIRRILVSLLVSVLAFVGAVILTPGYDMIPGGRPVMTAVGAALLLGVLNLAVRPLFIGLLAGVSVIAVAIATLVFQIVSFLILPVFLTGPAASTASCPRWSPR